MASIYGPNALDFKKKKISQEKQGPQEIPELSYTVITTHIWQVEPCFQSGLALLTSDFPAKIQIRTC